MAITTTEAATIARVTPSTIKRWADAGRVSFTRTAGGHRRFNRRDILEALRAQNSDMVSDADKRSSNWIETLLSPSRYTIDGALLTARGRLGSWHAVADELAAALIDVGKRWIDGTISISEEHQLSDSLLRSLHRLFDTLPIRQTGPRCVLACLPSDDHVLGLALAELCVREYQWPTTWLGARTPLDALRQSLDEEVGLLVVTATSIVERQPLAEATSMLLDICKQHDVQLVLGGSGPWPVNKTSEGVKLPFFRGESFEALSEFLSSHPQS